MSVIDFVNFFGELVFEFFEGCFWVDGCFDFFYYGQFFLYLYYFLLFIFDDVIIGYVGVVVQVC